jgi:hypothetical protein
MVKKPTRRQVLAGGLAGLGTLALSPLAFGQSRIRLRQRAAASGLIDPNWGLGTSLYVLEPFKVSGGELTDPFWLHLHEGQSGNDSLTVQMIAWIETWHTGAGHVPGHIVSTRDVPFADLPSGHQFRYVVKGRAITDWINLTAGATPVTISVTDAGFGDLLNGIHDFTVDVQGPNRDQFQPLPMFVHLNRDGYGDDPEVAIIARDNQARSSAQDEARWPPGTDYATYASVAATRFRGYPVNPNTVPWSDLPEDEADLYLEEMMPHTNLFMSQQMWWEEPPGTPDAGLKFLRAIAPKLVGGTEMRIIYDGSTGFSDDTTFRSEATAGQRTFPFRDGPRSVAWTSPFIWGQADIYGGFAFAEAGGPIRYMRPDGEIVTVAGWRVRADKEPIWWLKPYLTVRENMELRGTWLSGQWANESGIRLPFDVTIDPDDPNIWYTAGYYDHCIYKITITDRDTMDATVEVFAGSTSHVAGYTNATGTAARFRGPSSLVFDPVSDCLYVADQDNDAIRKITRAGVVTTLFGSPDQGGRLQTAGATNIIEDSWLAGFNYKLNTNRTFNRANSQFEIASGSPEMYAPFCVRVDSTGRLVVYDAGFSSIRRLDPTNGEAIMMVDFDVNIGSSNRVPIWLDVDRWGNSGPLNHVYFGMSGTSVLEDLVDRRTNELWGHCPIDANSPGDALWLFGEDNDVGPHGWGLRTLTDPPHYPWAVTVDPRGGLIFTGIGEHGICRMRLKRSDDPLIASNSDYYNGRFVWWRQSTGGSTRTDYTGNGAIAPSTKYGSEGHNTVGLSNTWAMDPSVSDAALIAAFELPASLQADATQLALVLNYLRKNTGGWRCLFHLKCQLSELSGTTNGATLTPTLTEGPATGTLIKLGTGAIAFEEVRDGTGVKFTPGGQQQTNTAFYKFLGADIGNLFKAYGEISFDIKSARNYADRIALPSIESRTVFQVFDHAGVEVARFAIEVQLGDHVKAVFNMRGLGGDYTIGSTAGVFNPIFGAGKIIRFQMRWESNTLKVYQDGVEKFSWPQTFNTPTWGANAIFTVGANAGFGGGYWCSDDTIDNFYIFGRD